MEEVTLIVSPYSKLFYIEWQLDKDRYDHNLVFDQNLEGNIDVSKLDKAINRFITDYVLLNSHIEERDEILYWRFNTKICGLEYFKDKLSEKQIFLSALHPRLKTPMRTMDHFLFVAEHDDHHLVTIKALIKVT